MHAAAVDGLLSGPLHAALELGWRQPSFLDGGDDEPRDLAAADRSSGPDGPGGTDRRKKHHSKCQEVERRAIGEKRQIDNDVKATSGCTPTEGSQQQQQ